MTSTLTSSEYGVRTAKAEMQFQRLLPGPIERVWAYVTESEKRVKWLAAGEMDLRVGGRVQLKFENEKLSAAPDILPEHHTCGGVDHGGIITQIQPPHLLTFSWGFDPESCSAVTFDLAEQADGKVLLTLTHSRLTSRGEMLSISGGWHTHLDILGDVLDGEPTRPFWSNHQRLQAHYDKVLVD